MFAGQLTTVALERHGKVLKVPSQKTCLLQSQHLLSGEKQG
jgi:hypothetical protein